MVRFKNSGCVAAAFKLKEEYNHQGRIYFVRNIEEEFVNQAVYVPPWMLNHPEKHSSIYPLNQQDNGYSTNMTLETVLKHGILLDRR